jgi:hypothetical protein
VHRPPWENYTLWHHKRFPIQTTCEHGSNEFSGVLCSIATTTNLQPSKICCQSTPSDTPSKFSASTPTS